MKGFSNTKCLCPMAHRWCWCLNFRGKIHPWMAEKLPSKAYSSSSLMEGAKVLAHQQVKMEPDSDAMESELKDPVSHDRAVQFQG